MSTIVQRPDLRRRGWAEIGPFPAPTNGEEEIKDQRLKCNACEGRFRKAAGAIPRMFQASPPPPELSP